MFQRRSFLLAAAFAAGLPSAAAAQQSFEYRNVCGGTSFVFCASVRFEQAAWSPYYFTLSLMNHSGAVKGYRGAVVTEVRFEGVDRPDRKYTSGMDGSSHFHPGPLHTDFLDGEVAPPFDNYGFRGEYTGGPLLGVMSFRSSGIGLRTAASPPWGLQNGVASSCGEDLFDSALALFVSASCGYGSGSLVRTHEQYPYNTSEYSPWTTSWLEDWDGIIEGPASGRTDVPTYDFRSAGLTLVAQDVRDPSRISVCRLGSATCAVVTPEPGTAPLLAGFLLLLGVLLRRSRRWARA